MPTFLHVTCTQMSRGVSYQKSLLQTETVSVEWTDGRECVMEVSDKGEDLIINKSSLQQ